MWMQDATAGARASSGDRKRPASGSRWIVVAVIVGVSVGLLLPDHPGATGFRASDLVVVSTLFLRMVKSLIAPLVFATLVVGIAGHGSDLKGVGRLAVRSIVYFEIVTTIALVVGLVTGNLVRPGRGVAIAASAVAASTVPAGPPPSLVQMLEHVVPESVVDAMARNDALQLVVFALLFAI